MAEIITLDNYEARMPKWHPQASSHLYALVDMGSNGIRFSISDLTPPRARLLKCIYRERAAISLFDDLNASSPSSGKGVLTFSKPTIRAVSRTVARFVGIALDYGVPRGHISVFATEAMRRAANAGDMLDAIRLATDGQTTVQVLAPEVETLFGSVGARSGFAHVKGLFLDLGGGSVQMTYLDTTPTGEGGGGGGGEDGEGHDGVGSGGGGGGYELVAAQWGQSMPFGAAKLIRIVGGTDAKAKSATRADLGSSMLAALGRLCGRFPDLARAVRGGKGGGGGGGGGSGSSKDRKNSSSTTTATAAAGAGVANPGGGGVDVYLCGGGFRGYGSMLMHNDAVQPYPIPLMGGYTVAGEVFAATKAMDRVNALYDDKIFGMSKRRRQQFPAIVCVVEALCEVVPNINTVTFCAGGNREGALMLKLPREVREANPVMILASPAGGGGGGGGSSLGSSSSNQLLLPQHHHHHYPIRSAPALQAVVEALRSATPSNLPKPDDYFPPALLPLLAQRTWERCGDDGGANASFALNDTLLRDPSAPGLNHLARASLAIALWTRWGGALPPRDRQSLLNLARLMGGLISESLFWAEYYGATAATLALLFPAPPRDEAQVRKGIRFEATRFSKGKKNDKDEIQLKISVASSRAVGLDPGEVKDCFKKVARYRPGTKVVVEVEEFAG